MEMIKRSEKRGLYLMPEKVDRKIALPVYQQICDQLRALADGSVDLPIYEQVIGRENVFIPTAGWENSIKWSPGRSPLRWNLFSGTDC